MAVRWVVHLAYAMAAARVENSAGKMAAMKVFLLAVLKVAQTGGTMAGR